MAIDIYGRTWHLPEFELCSVCGQPDNCSDCNHKELTSAEAKELKFNGRKYRQK